MNKILDFLASNTLFLVTLPWLVVLVVAGTIAQTAIGLDASLEVFFTSFILWLGIIPLPSGLTTLGILALNLMVKLCWKTEFKPEKSGIILTHIAILCFIISGGLSYLFSSTGYIIFAENERVTAMRDYVEHEFLIFKDDQLIDQLALSQARAGTEILLPETRQRIRIGQSCFNCATYRPDNKTANARQGLAAQLTIQPKAQEKQRENNIAGVEFSVIESDDSAVTYVSLSALPTQAPSYEIGENQYRFVVQNKRYPLPFSLELIDFEKKEYAASNLAKAYQSLVKVDDETEALIEMNDPLRIGDIALYQSSYLKRGAEQASVLAVVINPYYWMPYLSGILLFLGLLIHSIFRVREMKGEVK